MGSDMSLVSRGIRWSGSGTELNLFVATSGMPSSVPEFSFDSGHPYRVSSFYLEDEFRFLDGLILTEYNIRFEETPVDLAGYLTACLRSMVDGGARAAWFRGEGPFEFDTVLGPDLANHIYATIDSAGRVDVALEDEKLLSAAWVDHLAQLRDTLRDQRPLLRASVTKFSSPGVDLERFSPRDRADVSLVIEMDVAADGDIGREDFTVTVCTPQYLARWRDGDGPIIGRHHLIVKAWEWSEISAFLAGAVRAEVAPTWAELRDRIGRIGKWVYEDYGRYSPPEAGDSRHSGL